MRALLLWLGRGLLFILLFLAGHFAIRSVTNVFASEPIAVGYRDFSYPSGTGSNGEVTAEKPESKLWWNDGSWWGSLWSTSANAYHIYRLDQETQSWIDTGTQLDDRSDSKADVLWDEGNQKLYVVSHIWSGSGSTAIVGNRGELFRYSYNSGSYTLDAGFPVEVNDAETETLILEKGGNGQLWVTYVKEDDQDGDYKVWVNRSLNGDDATWGEPFVLPVAGAEVVSSDDIASIIAYNNHVGVMWSNQKSPKAMYFAVHSLGAPDNVWTPVRAYSVSSDDHINLKSLETDSAGNVFAAIKTSNSSELIVLLVCQNNLNRCKDESDWLSYPVYQSSTHSPTRPSLLIDTSNRELYVFTRNKDVRGDWGIYYKKSPLDNIKFSDDIGIPFIKSSTETRINDPTSTKQNLNSTTGMVVLASDSSAKYYFHNYLDLNSTVTETPTFTPTATNTASPTFTPTNTPTPTPTATNTFLPDATFTFTPSPTTTNTSTPTATTDPLETPTASPISEYSFFLPVIMYIENP